MIIFILCCIAFISCSQKQIPFNKKQWMREKNRFYMTDSLIEKLNEDKPKRTEISKKENYCNRGVFGNTGREIFYSLCKRALFELFCNDEIIIT